MAEYITANDVENRLTTAGYEWVADRDVSGTGVNATEESRFITPAIQYAGALVDEAVSPFTEPSDARAAGNQWLKDRCLDLAVRRAVTLAASQPNKAIQEDYDDARERLERVRRGEIRVPGYNFSKPSQGPGRTTSHLRSYNVR